MVHFGLGIFSNHISLTWF